MDKDNDKGPTTARWERRMRGWTTMSPMPSLVAATKEKAKQLCGTAQDVAMDVAAVGTRA